MNDFDKKNVRAYFWELGGAMTVYAVLLVASVTLFNRGLVAEAWEPVVVLLPMLGFAVTIWAIVRMLNRVDELQKRYIKDDIFIAFWGTAFISLSYGFLEQVGFPKLSMFWVWGVMGGLWLLVWLLQVARMKLNGSIGG